MPFSYDRAWQDVVAMFRDSWVLLLTLAGVFVFFPAFVLFVFAPMPEAQPNGTPQAALQLIYTYYETTMVWLILVNAIAALGQAAILSLLLDRARPTVSEALVVAAGLFPGFFVAQLLTNFAIGATALLVVPAIYLLGRLSVVGPLLIAQRLGNPIRAIALGWAATQKRGWRIAGLMMLVVIVSWIALSATTSALTILGALIVPESARPLVGGFAGAISSTGLSLLMTVLSAAIYRQLAAGDRLGDVFG
jgi:hypothetical protein